MPQQLLANPDAVVSIDLYADDSAAATVGLEESLREQGYVVRLISTDTHEPVARTGYCFFSGYGNIAAQLLR